MALGRRQRREGTGPELLVRFIAEGLGLSYVANDRSLPGTPDIHIPAARAVILVHGCFWHGHGCRSLRALRPWWRRKIQMNRRHDAMVETRLAARGLAVLVVWECELSSPGSVVSRIRTWLKEQS